MGLGLFDLPVTNFSALNICIQILINMGHALEYGLKIGCSQGNTISLKRKQTNKRVLC